MRVLYAIQGTGNGHLSRALDIVPILQRKCELDILISGSQAELQLPFEVRYQYKGLSFIFGKKGGIDYLRTYLQHKTRRLYREVLSLPVTDYDLVINDFEPVSAWAARLKGVPCVSLSHQCAVLSAGAPRPKRTDHLGRLILQRYAPAEQQIGFHFDRYAPWVHTPVIRQQIRTTQPTKLGHYTVYLPAYKDERLIKVLAQIPEVQWEVFSKKTDRPYREGNVFIRPVDGKHFLASFTSCTGILCGAGFETPAEALYMGKKLMVIPMKGQYEQHCNAAALQELGVPVIKSLKKKHLAKITNWVRDDEAIRVHYPDETELILEELLHSVDHKLLAS